MESFSITESKGEQKPVPIVMMYIEEAHNLIGKNDKIESTWPKIAKEGAAFQDRHDVFDSRALVGTSVHSRRNGELFRYPFEQRFRNQNLESVLRFKDFAEAIKQADDVGFSRIKTLSAHLVSTDADSGVQATARSESVAPKMVAKVTARTSERKQCHFVGRTQERPGTKTFCSTPMWNSFCVITPMFHALMLSNSQNFSMAFRPRRHSRVPFPISSWRLTAALTRRPRILGNRAARVGYLKAGLVALDMKKYRELRGTDSALSIRWLWLDCRTVARLAWRFLART